MCVHEKENVNKKFEKEREKELCKTEIVGDSPIWFENAFYYDTVPCKSCLMFCPLMYCKTFFSSAHVQTIFS